MFARFGASRPKMNMQSLPDDCLLLIFEQCPLQELIPLRVVSQRWSVLILLHCRGKHTLKLFGSFRGLVDYAKRLKRYQIAQNGSDFKSTTMDVGSELIIRGHHFNMDIVYKLGEIFPNVHSLVLYYYNWPSEEIMQMLLKQFEQMASLTVHGLPPGEDSQRIWAHINLIPNLLRLHLLGMRNITIPPQMPILRKLQQFSLTDYGKGDIVPILSQLGPECKTVLLDFVLCSSEIMQQVHEENEHFHNITCLFLGNMLVPKQRVPPPQFIEGIRILPQLPPQMKPPENAEQILNFACENCTTMEYLDTSFMLDKSYFKLPDLLHQFGKLKQLTSMRLLIRHGDLDSFDSSMPQLESIRSLQLELFPLPVDQFVEVMAWIFPNLEHLKAECFDQNTKKQLMSRLEAIDTPFGKLAQIDVFYQRDLSHYFSGFGYTAKYLTYIKEHMGVMADLL